MALGNMGARSARAGARALWFTRRKVEGNGTTKTKFALFARFRQYPQSTRWVEQPNGDFARTMVRQFFYACVCRPLWRACEIIAHRPNATAGRQCAGKSEKGKRNIHVRTGFRMEVRLGDGTEESHRRSVRARSTISGPLPVEMFAPSTRQRRTWPLESSAGHRRIDPVALCAASWLKTINPPSSASHAVFCRGTAMRRVTPATAATSEHLAICSASCKSMQRSFRGRYGRPSCSAIMIWRQRAWGRRGRRGRPGDPGPDIADLGRAARGCGQRRPCRSGDHATYPGAPR